MQLTLASIRTGPAAASGLPPLPLPASDGLGAAPRRLVVVGIVAAHLLALWGLLQVRAVREAAVQTVPILVSLLPTPVAPAPPAPPPPLPEVKPEPKRRVRPKPAPRPPVLASPVRPAPEAVAVAPAPEPPAPPAPPVVPATSAVVAEPAPAPTPAAPPAPKQFPDDAVRYLQAPQVVYPPLSLRRRETGLVVVRADVGTEGGAPRRVQVQTSSGHTRLDQAALAAVQGARFRPYLERGQPVEGWALIPIRFELEK